MAQHQRDEEGFDKTFPNYVLVDNVPADVDAKRVDKLRTALGKTFKKESGVVVKEIEIPLGENGKTLGAAFVECNNAEDADTLCKKMNGFAFDQAHTFVLNKWNDLLAQDSLPPSFVPPKQEDTTDTEMNLQDWLSDPLGNDQFATLVDNVTEINVNNAGGERPQVRARRTAWTDKWICWSTRGTYFATVHQPEPNEGGVVLWGGPDFTKIRRFHHSDVDWMQFSPAENYLVTYSGKHEKEAYIIWNVVTGEKMKSYSRTQPFQAFQWSFDDKYYARLSEGLVTVYETPTGSILGKSSIKLSGAIESFKWSPTDHYLACYVPTVDEKPAKVALLSIPDRRELSQKILYGVTDCKLHWHPNGDYLAAEVAISVSKGKKPYTSFELFLVREKGMPVDNLKIDDACVYFEWEPRGKRFGIVHTEDTSSTTRYNVSFYSLEPKQVKLISTLEKRQANELHWSPGGRICVLVGIRSHNGVFEFYDVQEKETLANDLHHQLTTDVSWDPTGRYFVTFVSHWKERLENGFIMWSLTGQKLHQEAKPKFCQFLWRPRPPTLLSKEEEARIEKNLKQYSEIYKKEDELKKKELHEHKRAHKATLADQFHAFLKKSHEEWLSQTAKRRALRNGYISDDEDNWQDVEKWVEVIIDEKHEVVSQP
jgi:translation initiation factor 3 subunit B